MIYYTCMHCFADLETDDIYSCKTEPCPVCGKVNTVPKAKEKLKDVVNSCQAISEKIGAEGFQMQSCGGPTLIQKIFSRPCKDNVLTEINNLFANTSEMAHVTVERILAIGEKYKVDIYHEYGEELRAIFAGYLKYTLQDGQLSSVEVGNLRHMQTIFYLSRETVKSIQQNVCHELYAKQLEEAASDGKLNEVERQKLHRLKQYFQISDEDMVQMYKKEARKVMEGKIKEILKTGRYSPEDEKQLNDIANDFGSYVSYDQETRECLDICRRLWNIDNGILPEYNVPFDLQKEEKCHYYSSTNWYEIKNGEKHGVDSGVLYVSNKRIIFMGEQKSLSVNIGRVIGFSPCEVGVEIQKTAGNNLIFDVGNRVLAGILCTTLRHIVSGKRDGQPKKETNRIQSVIKNIRNVKSD
ncbi:MAG: hypothetical protein ABFD91_18540 [Anaerohalosphaeraceae bacterium]